MDILVVDDEETVGRIFAQRLRKEISSGGLSLHFATNGTQALQILEEKRSKVVLILSDINMPGMSGLELLRRIRALDSVIRIYMVSAYDNDEFRQQSLALGANGFFPKPLEFAELKTLLEDL